jgi:hypothetical protein
MSESTEHTTAAEPAVALRTNLLFQLAVAQPIAISGNTQWEQLRCVGYNPQIGKLEAVVVIKRATGYSGGLCTTGSTEYVRFFVDWGAGFEHVGLASFKAHDIPDAPVNRHPIDYAVELPLDIGKHRRPCERPVLPRVRAVLSWNVPPNLDPNQVPIYGNHLDAHIQLAPLLQLPPLSGISVQLTGMAALQEALAAVTLPHLSLTELATAYRRANIPAHRFLLPALAPLLQNAAPGHLSLASEAAQLKNLGIDLQAAAQAVLQSKGDTSFEELTCIGLETDIDTLGAVIRVKRPYGYSGDLCHSGSNEYVAFWADWDNSGTFDEYLGTAQVRVHDIGGALPGDGLAYSVMLFSPSFAKHLRACTTPTVVRIRGVLSWAVPPSTVDPNASVVWGNHLDVLVQVRPGIREGLIDAIYRVGGVAIPDISTTTFLAYPSLVLSGDCSQPAMDRPFGDIVTVQGRIYNAGPAGSVRYRIRYKRHADPDVDANWVPVTLAQHYTLIIPPATFIPVDQVAGTEPGLGGGWFDYIEDMTVSPPKFEIDARLADWNTGSLEGQYDLRLEYRRISDPAGFYLRSSVVTITLHNHNFVTNVVPGVALDPSLDLDIVILGGDCHSYEQGSVINGALRVEDPYFWKWSLDIEPASHVHGAAITPPCRAYTSLADSGDASASYQIDTSKLDKCGYALILRGWDRTIRSNNGAVTHFAAKAVGFSVV